MGHRKFWKDKPRQDLRDDDSNLNETTYLNYALSRFELISESQFDEFAYHQTSLADDLSTSFLEFKGIKATSITGLDNLHLYYGVKEDRYVSEQEPEHASDLTASYENKLRKIKQKMYLIHSITQKIEKNLYLNTQQTGTQSQEEIETLRLKELQENEDIYRGLDFGGNYQLDKEYSSHSQTYSMYRFNRQFIKSQNMNLFTIPNNDETNFIISAVHLESISDYIGASQKMKSIKQKQNKEVKNLSISFPFFTSMIDFYKFDDVVQSILIDHSKNFEEIRIVIDYECHLAIVSLIRFLLLIKSCNIITIQFGEQGSYSFSQPVQKISIIIERIFSVILSIRNLQSLTIQMNSILLPYFCTGINRITDPSKLNLRYFYLNGDLQKANTDNIAECIEFFSRIPSLYSFQTDTIVISGTTSEEQFQKLLLSIPSIEVSLQEIPRDFSFILSLNNLIKFDFTLTLEPMQFSETLLDQLLGSIKSAKNLVIFKLQISSLVNQHTYRRNILLDEQEQNTEKESNQDPPNLLLFKHLFDLLDLKQFQLECNITENIYVSLLKLLENNSNILEMILKFQNPSHLQFDFLNIFEILNNRENIKNFSLNIWDSISIAYKLRSQISKSYYFQCECQEDFDCLTKNPSYFNPTNFRFNNVTSMKFKLRISDFQELDNIFESIQNTPHLVFIEMSVEPSNLLSEKLPKEQISNPMFRFFSRLENHQSLKHIDFNSFISQQVLDSLEVFLRKSTSLKQLFITRFSSNQFYLNYAGVLNAISASKSVEQLYWKIGIEEIAAPSQANISKWEQVKQTNFYRPFADLYRNASSQLTLIEINEQNLFESGINILLQGIVDSSNQIYTKFSHGIFQQLEKVTNQNTKALINQANMSGRLVTLNYNFPLSYSPKYEKLNLW